jgi:hypothetical protein
MDLTSCAVENTEEEPAYKPDTEPYYSNQKKAGTCVRHALAKGIFKEISGYLGDNVRIDIRGVVITLINMRPQYGGGGASPSHWDGAEGVVLCRDELPYLIKVKVFETPINDSGSYHVISLDLTHFIDGYRPSSWHAMFVENRSQNGTLFLRNSWGHVNKILKVNPRRLAMTGARAYYVRVVRFERLRGASIGQIVLCNNGVWKCKCCGRNRASNSSFCRHDHCGFNQCQKLIKGIRCQHPCRNAPSIMMCNRHY